MKRNCVIVMAVFLALTTLFAVNTGAESFSHTAPIPQWTISDNSDMINTIPNSEMVSIRPLTASGIKSVFGVPGEFTAEQTAELANIEKGISIIGASSFTSAIKSVSGFADNNWSDGAGYPSWYLTYDSNGNIVRYNAKGEAGQEDSIYISLITYNFKSFITFDAFALLASSSTKWPQAGDVYISNDGIDWQLAGGWDFNAVKLIGGDGYGNGLADGEREKLIDGFSGKAPARAFMFKLNGETGKYIRFGFTKGGRDGCTGSEYDTMSKPTAENQEKVSIELREIVVWGTGELPPDETEATTTEPVTEATTAEPVTEATTTEPVTEATTAATDTDNVTTADTAANDTTTEAPEDETTAETKTNDTTGKDETTDPVDTVTTGSTVTDKPSETTDKPSDNDKSCGGFSVVPALFIVALSTGCVIVIKKRKF